MPTYEYTCTACGDHLEVVQSFRDEPLSVCPACGGQLRKVFGSIGVVFKGSGFYKTDSRPAASSSSSPGKEPKSGEKSSSATDGGGASKPADGSKTPSDAGGKEKKSETTSSAGKSAAAS